MWSHQDENGLGIFEPLKIRTWQDISSLKGVLLGRQCLVDSVFKLLFAALCHWGLRIEVEGGGYSWCCGT